MQDVALKWIVALCVTLCIATPALAQGRTRAVLIGVGDYLYLDADLQGPVNDVALMADMLMRRGVAGNDIVVLSDPEANLPDGITPREPLRATILAALNDAVAASAAGDLLVIYFSGHGAQAPDLDGDEQGGFDEIFLPRDAKSWNGAIGAVENAILDDEFGAIARAAAARDVRLVGIMDACHSATGFRALRDEAGRARYIAPVDLGIPDVAPSVPAAPTAPAMGDFVFLYAAQSDQRAFEYPVGDGEARRWYGDFTRNLVNVLTDVPDLSYDQLAQAIALRVQSRDGQVAQTPDIEGPMATAPVFGAQSAGMRRIAIARGVLAAGQLQDVTPGSEVTVYADLLASEPAGRAIVRGVRATEAELEFLDPVPVVAVTHGEITRRAPDVSFSVGLAPEAEARLEALAPGGAQRLAEALEFPISRQGAQNRVVWTGKAFALVGRDGILDALGPGSSPRLVYPAVSADPVGDLVAALEAQARSARLEQALAQVARGAGGATGFTLFKTGPDVALTLLPGRLVQGRCRTDAAAAREVAHTADAAHCDALSVTLTNGTSKMMDVTILFVDAEAQVSVLWPTTNLSNRIPSGETRDMAFGLRNDGEPPRTLHETLLVLTVPAAPGDTRTVLSALAHGGQTRGANGPMAGYLGALTDPDTATRGVALTPTKSTLHMTRLDLAVAPLRPDP